MASPRYAPAATQEQGSSTTSSQGSARLTPESDSEEEEKGYSAVGHGGDIPLERIEQHEEAQEDDATELDSDSDSDDSIHVDRSDRRARRGSTQSFELYTPDEEKAVLRKLDRRLVLLMAVLYLLSFLDRSNIGNARIAGLTEDLRLSPSQYEWLLTAFYITYILFEWMTLLYRVVPAHIYIPLCVFAWGMLASLQAVSVNFASMLVLRALLGFSEAAFGPGVPFYLSFFFRREELAFRTGLFISAAPLASSFASSLAYAIVRLGGHTGICSWRLLFLVEGFPSVLVAAAAWVWRWVPDSPETASWLRPRERKIAVLRLRREKPGLGMGEKGSTGSRTEQGRRRGRLDWKEIGKTLADPKSYLTAAMFFSCNVAFSSMPVFAPVIIKDMGYSALAAQGLSAPPYIYSFAVVLLTAWLSDRYSTRSIPIAIHALLAMLGYMGLALTPALHLPNAVRYLCIYPITAGFFSAVTLTIVWTINNQKSDEGKGTGVAVLNVIGQLGPLLGTRLYPDTDEPFFVKGHAVCAFFMLLVAILAGTLRVVLSRANRKGEDVVSGDRDADVPLVREEGRVGRTTTFVYML